MFIPSEPSDFTKYNFFLSHLQKALDRATWKLLFVKITPVLFARMFVPRRSGKQEGLDGASLLFVSCSLSLVYTVYLFVPPI